MPVNRWIHCACVCVCVSVCTVGIILWEEIWVFCWLKFYQLGNSMKNSQICTQRCMYRDFESIIVNNYYKIGNKSFSVGVWVNKLWIFIQGISLSKEWDRAIHDLFLNETCTLWKSMTFWTWVCYFREKDCLLYSLTVLGGDIPNC